MTRKATRSPAATVGVTRRPDDTLGLTRATIAGDPKYGYRIAYRGTLEQIILALEACTRKLWELRAARVEPPIDPDPPRKS